MSTRDFDPFNDREFGLRTTSGGSIHSPRTLTILSRVFDGLTPEEQWEVDRLYREVDERATKLLEEIRSRKDVGGKIVGGSRVIFDYGLNIETDNKETTHFFSHGGKLYEWDE